MFTSTIGTPLNRHNVFGRSFKPLLNKAGPPHRPLPRPQAHLRYPTLLQERKPQGGSGDARPRQHLLDDGYLLPRAAKHARRGRSHYREHFNLAGWHQVGTEVPGAPGLFFIGAFSLQIAVKRSGETRIRTGDTMIFSGVICVHRCFWLFRITCKLT